LKNNKSKSLFSIIVPIYNAEKFLEKCIDSIIRQTYPNIEVILINDGSTDDSLNICRRFTKCDKRINIVSQKNMGVSAAKNTGIAKAHGDFMIFIDADDHIENNMIEVFHDNLMRSDSDMVICGYSRIDHEKGIERKTKVSYAAREYLNMIHGPDFVDLYKMPMLNQNWNKVYKAEIVRDNGVCFQKELSLGEDLLFNLRYLEYCKKISIIEDILYNFICYNKDSLSRRYRDDFFEVQQRLFHEVAGYVDTNYSKAAAAEMLKGIEEVYLLAVISHISIVSRYGYDRFGDKYMKIKKMVFDKEVHDIALKTKKSSFKTDILICLIRMRSITLLILILRLRAWV